MDRTKLLNTNKYIRFPLRYLHDNHEGNLFSDMLQFGIVDYSCYMEFDENEINKMIQSGYTEDEAKVHCTLLDFDMDYVIDQVKGITRYGDKLVCQSMNLEQERGKREPMVKTSIAVLENYRDANDHQEIMYRLYFAIKSLIGKKRYVKATWRVVVARAFGCTKPEQLPEERLELFYQLTKKDSRLKQKYLDELQAKLFVQRYAQHTRLTYWGIGEDDKAAELAHELYKQKLKKVKAKAAQDLVKKQYQEELKRLKGGR